MGKYLEINGKMSLKRIRKILWREHVAHLRDDRSGKVYIKRTGTDNPQSEMLLRVLEPEFPH